MPAFAHTSALLLAITGVYVWLHQPELTPYSLQAFAFISLAYFILKRLRRAKFWHLAPEHTSIEMVLATAAFLLLIGSTGNTASLFYPLTYVHLFFLVLASHPLTAITVTMAVVAFHYGMTPDVAPEHLATLLSLPIVLVFFLFAKTQHQEVLLERSVIESEEASLRSLQDRCGSLTHFLLEFVQPKLAALEQLAQYPQENAQALKNQLSLLQIEIEKLVRTDAPPSLPQKISQDEPPQT